MSSYDRRTPYSSSDQARRRDDFARGDRSREIEGNRDRDRERDSRDYDRDRRRDEPRDTRGWDQRKDDMRERERERDLRDVGRGGRDDRRDSDRDRDRDRRDSRDERDIRPGEGHYGRNQNDRYDRDRDRVDFDRRGESSRSGGFDRHRPEPLDSRRGNQGSDRKPDLPPPTPYSPTVAQRERSPARDQNSRQDMSSGQGSQGRDIPIPNSSHPFSSSFQGNNHDRHPPPHMPFNPPHPSANRSAPPGRGLNNFNNQPPTFDQLNNWRPPQRLDGPPSASAGGPSRQNGDERRDMPPPPDRGPARSATPVDAPRREFDRSVTPTESPRQQHGDRGGSFGPGRTPLSSSQSAGPSSQRPTPTQAEFGSPVNGPQSGRRANPLPSQQELIRQQNAGEQNNGWGNRGQQRDRQQQQQQQQDRGVNDQREEEGRRDEGPSSRPGGSAWVHPDRLRRLSGSVPPNNRVDEARSERGNDAGRAGPSGQNKRPPEDDAGSRKRQRTGRSNSPMDVDERESQGPQQQAGPRDGGGHRNGNVVPPPMVTGTRRTGKGFDRWTPNVVKKPPGQPTTGNVTKAGGPPVQPDRRTIQQPDRGWGARAGKGDERDARRSRSPEARGGYGARDRGRDRSADRKKADRQRGRSRSVSSSSSGGDRRRRKRSSSRYSSSSEDLPLAQRRAPAGTGKSGQPGNGASTVHAKKTGRRDSRNRSGSSARRRRRSRSSFSSSSETSDEEDVKATQKSGKVPAKATPAAQASIPGPTPLSPIEPSSQVQTDSTQVEIDPEAVMANVVQAGDAYPIPTFSAVGEWQDVPPATGTAALGLAINGAAPANIADAAPLAPEPSIGALPPARLGISIALPKKNIGKETSPLQSKSRLFGAGAAEGAASKAQPANSSHNPKQETSSASKSQVQLPPASDASSQVDAARIDDDVEMDEASELDNVRDQLVTERARLEELQKGVYPYMRTTLTLMQRKNASLNMDVTMFLTETFKRKPHEKEVQQVNMLRSQLKIVLLLEKEEKALVQTTPSVPKKALPNPTIAQNEPQPRPPSSSITPWPNRGRSPSPVSGGYAPRSDARAEQRRFHGDEASGTRHDTRRIDANSIMPAAPRRWGAPKDETGRGNKSASGESPIPQEGHKDDAQSRRLEEGKTQAQPEPETPSVPPPPSNSRPRRASDRKASGRNREPPTPESAKASQRNEAVRPPAPAPKPPPFSIHEQGKPYEKVTQVGEGTYGKVYKARNGQGLGLVALKRIRLEGEKEGFPVTSMREIKLLQGLNHDNVIRLHEMMVSQGSVYMVFEYMEHDLTGVLTQAQFTFDESHLKSLSQQMLRGLSYLHLKSILHRDLKGSNILLNSKGELKLADFGLARFINKKKRNDYTNRVITLWYRSPELLMGETVYGPCVDMWSAGCIMLELYLRRPVFQGNDEIHQLEVIYAALGTPRHEDWPGLGGLPWYELVKPKQAIKNQFDELFGSLLTPAGKDVARGLLTYDPSKRLSADEALLMPYYTSELPAPVIPFHIEQVEGEWHEMESKQDRARKRVLEQGQAQALTQGMGAGTGTGTGSGSVVSSDR